MRRPEERPDAGLARLDCVRCDRRELPDGYDVYRTTPTFEAGKIPAALLSRHSTKRGVWGRIRVQSGRLLYRIHEPYCEEQLLESGASGLVLPEVEHEVEPLGPVEFVVEFYRARTPKETNP